MMVFVPVKLIFLRLGGGITSFTEDEERMRKG
jgi:hypothetical protein